jgi:hypothetical protein
MEPNHVNRVEKFGRRPIVINEDDYLKPLYCQYCHHANEIVIEASRDRKWMCRQCYNRQFDAIFKPVSKISSF